MIFASLCREIAESNLMQKSSFFMLSGKIDANANPALKMLRDDGKCRRNPEQFRLNYVKGILRPNSMEKKSSK